MTPHWRSNQPILKKINPEYSLEGLMLKLKLKLQYFGRLPPCLVWNELGETPGLRRWSPTNSR